MSSHGSCWYLSRAMLVATSSALFMVVVSYSSIVLLLVGVFIGE